MINQFTAFSISTLRSELRRFMVYIVWRGFVGLLPVIVSGSLLVALSSQIDYELVFGHLRLISLWSMFAGIAAFLGSIIIAAERSSLVVSDVTGVRPLFSNILRVNFV